MQGLQRRSSGHQVNLSRIIEEATHEFLPAENVSLNLEFCDMLKSFPDAHKEGAKLIRKRLQQTNSARQNSSLWYTLILLDTCVKNCGYAFQVQVMNKDYLSELVKILHPKYNPPVHVQEKILSMIQSWALAFRNNPEMRDVEKVYEDLKVKGVEFPPIDSAESPALLTMNPLPPPQNASLGTLRSPGPDTSYYPQQPPRPQQTHPRPASTGAAPSAAHPQSQMSTVVQKLRQDLAIVSGNVRVLKDMLSILRPENIPEDDLQLMQELNRTCRAMQVRLLQLLEDAAVVLPDDNIMNEMLLINDELNNTFLRYDRFEKCRQALPGAAANSSAISPPANRAREEELIRLHDTPTNVPASRGFDPFNQPAPPAAAAAAAATSTNRNSFLPGIPDTRSELDEMEQWMRANQDFTTTNSTLPQPTASARPPTSSQQSTLSSEEFDKFLDAQMRANPDLRSSRPLPKPPTNESEEPSLIKFD